MRRRGLVCAALIVVVFARSGSGEGGKEKVASLAKCPPWGVEARGGTRAVLNEVKHHLPTGTTPTMLEFADLATLQQQADGLVKSGVKAKVLAKDRAKLKNLASNGRQFSEGDLVGIVAFVAGRPSANPGESANCYLRGMANNDFEFSLVPTATATPYEGIVAEMIPQDRPSTWSLDKLRKLAAEHRRVQVFGQLMFDTRHVPNSKPGTNRESPRASTWEIHPVTKMLVCQHTGECDPKIASDWQPIESMSSR